MKNAYYERERIIEKIGGIVEKNFCWTGLLFRYDISKEAKGNDRELYDKGLKVFHYAFSLGKKGRIYLWHTLHDEKVTDESAFDKSNFNDEEWNFLMKAFKFVPYPKNINAPIFSERLELLPLNYGDDIVNPFVREVEDCERQESEGRNIYSKRKHDFYGGDLFFGIYLKGNIIGVIGLDYCLENTELYHLSCYIQKAQRGNGYATEVLKKLIEVAFGQGLKEHEETLYNGIFEKVTAVINVISVSVMDKEEAAIHTLKKLGFKCDGRVRYRYRSYDGYHDELLFSLVNPNFKG